MESGYTLGRQPSPVADDAVSGLPSPNFELLATQAYVVPITEHIKVDTAVEVLPICNAVLNARQLATIDRFSQGRLLLGVGVGWLEEEADATNVPWDRRGARAVEYISLLRTVWAEPGPHVEFPPGPSLTNGTAP